MVRPAVAAGHDVTAAAAAQVLAAGGNAFDAAVAAGFASAVAEPVLSSLGGGGFLLARTAAGDEVCFDFFVDAPGRGIDAGVLPQLASVELRFGGTTQVFHVGHGSVAVPGCLAGYLHVHDRLGRSPLDEVVAPAVRAAERGVVLGAGQVAVVHLVEDILTATATGRDRFRPGGQPLRDDAVVADPQLGELLARIGAGTVRGFDDPSLAADIERANRDGGGVLTAADLAAYRVYERDPLRLRYRDATLTGNPPPSSGASMIGRALAAAAAAPAIAVDDPDRLVRLAAVLGAMTAGPPRPPTAVRGTTHVSVVDGEGNLAAMTVSNGSGSGVHLGATGVLANNIMGEEDLLGPLDGSNGVRWPAGTRIGSMMAPGVLDLPDGSSVVLGSGGSERIRSALTQVVLRLVDEPVDLATAVAAPRVHLDATGTLQVEPGHPDAHLAALRADGIPHNVWTTTDLYFGGTHAVSTDGQHVGDHRRGGVSRRV